jgi:hypothetical protein
MAKLEKLVKKVYDIDEDQGGVAFAMKCRLENHEVVKINRKDKKMTVWYRKKS